MAARATAQSEATMVSPKLALQNLCSHLLTLSHRAPRRSLIKLAKRGARGAGVVVVAVLPLVYASQAQVVEMKDRHVATKLPDNVADTREQILAAVRAASFDDLGAIIDAAHSKPDLGVAGKGDALSELKALSRDGRGLDILAALAECLDLPPATLPLGRDIENNLIYVWPYLAERPPDQLSAREQIDLYRLVSPAKAAEMREKKRWLWWRLAIAADGSWMAFSTSE